MDASGFTESGASDQDNKSEYRNLKGYRQKFGIFYSKGKWGISLTYQATTLRLKQEKTQVRAVLKYDLNATLVKVKVDDHEHIEIRLNYEEPVVYELYKNMIGLIDPQNSEAELDNLIDITVLYLESTGYESQKKGFAPVDIYIQALTATYNQFAKTKGEEPIAIELEIPTEPLKDSIEGTLASRELDCLRPLDRGYEVIVTVKSDKGVFERKHGVYEEQCKAALVHDLACACYQKYHKVGSDGLYPIYNGIKLMTLFDSLASHVDGKKFSDHLPNLVQELCIELIELEVDLSDPVSLTDDKLELVLEVVIEKFENERPTEEGLELPDESSGTKPPTTDSEIDILTEISEAADNSLIKLEKVFFDRFGEDLEKVFFDRFGEDEDPETWPFYKARFMEATIPSEELLDIICSIVQHDQAHWAKIAEKKAVSSDHTMLIDYVEAELVPSVKLKGKGSKYKTWIYAQIGHGKKVVNLGRYPQMPNFIYALAYDFYCELQNEEKWAEKIVFKPLREYYQYIIMQVGIKGEKPGEYIPPLVAELIKLRADKELKPETLSSWKKLFTHPDQLPAPPKTIGLYRDPNSQFPFTKITLQKKTYYVRGFNTDNECMTAHDLLREAYRGKQADKKFNFPNNRKAYKALFAVYGPFAPTPDKDLFWKLTKLIVGEITEAEMETDKNPLLSKVRRTFKKKKVVSILEKVEIPVNYDRFRVGYKKTGSGFKTNLCVAVGRHYYSGTYNDEEEARLASDITRRVYKSGDPPDVYNFYELVESGEYDRWIERKNLSTKTITHELISELVYEFREAVVLERKTDEEIDAEIEAELNELMPELVADGFVAIIDALGCTTLDELIELKSKNGYHEWVGISEKNGGYEARIKFNAREQKTFSGHKEEKSAALVRDIMLAYFRPDLLSPQHLNFPELLSLILEVLSGDKFNTEEQVRRNALIVVDYLFELYAEVDEDEVDGEEVSSETKTSEVEEVTVDEEETQEPLEHNCIQIIYPDGSQTTVCQILTKLKTSPLDLLHGLNKLTSTE